MNKWKDHYLCGMTTMKNFKNYFDFVRIKENDFCAYKTKKCGRIDTLNYYLCTGPNPFYKIIHLFNISKILFYKIITISIL